MRARNLPSSSLSSMISDLAQPSAFSSQNSSYSFESVMLVSASSFG